MAICERCGLFPAVARVRSFEDGDVVLSMMCCNPCVNEALRLHLQVKRIDDGITRRIEAHCLYLENGKDESNGN